MGRGKDFRQPRRRGFDDDDYAPPRSDSFASAPRHGSPPRDPVPAGPPVKATVQWFNGTKGFGFVALDDGGGDAFLHIAVLERSGLSAVPPGAKLLVRIGQGQKGPQVTEVLEVDESTATAPATRPRAPGGFDSRSGLGAPAGEAVAMAGTVKWFNPDKGFGFVAVESGGKDVFIHISALQRSGLTGLSEGQRVNMDVREGRKGPEAVAIRPAD